MNEQQARNLKINGIGQSAGGTYGKISTDGIATLNGDTDCVSLTSNGTLKLKGSARAQEFRMNGKASAEGPLYGKKLRIDGMLNIAGDLRVEQNDINGILTITGSASGERMEIDGSMKLEGSAEFETFKVHGGFQIGEMLNAGTLDIYMAGACRAKEIGGERIQVRRKASARSLLAFLSPALAVRLTADVIEGDDIRLEETKADVVRGNSVIIGPGCEIGRVEYRHRYEADPSASVGRAEQV
ncbi:hypothetical protein V3851_20020 [Paenibacillus sp. M1]|uniref:Polymer-forming cytoskeletal protein n=1 Tax=Paenibacillus haidiansis TaxID=1574488 RepID=A0ABU7VWH7_9BACL